MSPKTVSPSLTEQLSTADRPLARQERFGQVFEDAGGGLTRRAVLGAGLAAAAATLLPACAPTPTTLLPAGLTPPIRSRATWGADLPPLRPMRIERVGDVRFLLVHHTASSNDYAPGDVGGLLRGFYRYHTSRVKGWPDIAYNFLIDRYGNVWEGRTGSLHAPVCGDATGGSQGFALLCCYVGDHTTVAPTRSARAAMLRMLAALATAYRIDTRPGARTQFVSRGSSRYPAGRLVTTATIAGHRDMSTTACPGDAAYADVRTRYPADVTALRVAYR